MKIVLLYIVIHFSQLSERERSAANRIEIARGEVAMEWESRLMEEMNRLKMELEQCHLDDRNVALNELKGQHLLESQAMVTKYKRREEQFGEEVCKSNFLCVTVGMEVLLCLISNLFSFFIYSTFFVVLTELLRAFACLLSS